MHFSLYLRHFFPQTDIFLTSFSEYLLVWKISTLSRVSNSQPSSLPSASVVLPCTSFGWRAHRGSPCHSSLLAHSDSAVLLVWLCMKPVFFLHYLTFVMLVRVLHPKFDKQQGLDCLLRLLVRVVLSPSQRAYSHIDLLLAGVMLSFWSVFHLV